MNIQSLKKNPVVERKKKKMLYVAVQGDIRVQDKEFEKIQAYHLLNDEIWRPWNVKNMYTLKRFLVFFTNNILLYFEMNAHLVHLLHSTKQILTCKIFQSPKKLSHTFMKNQPFLHSLKRTHFSSKDKTFYTQLKINFFKQKKSTTATYNHVHNILRQFNR